MKYDRHGFPIPPEFDLPATEQPDDRAARVPSPGVSRRAAAGTFKRFLLVAAACGVLLPAVVWPAVRPVIREAVVQWSLERAFGREARGRIPAAITNLDRAISWTRDEPQQLSRLLCWRAMLKIENRDARGAIADASRAIEAAPTSPQARRVRALAHVVAGSADEAVADAHVAVDIAGKTDPEALNHRAYIRALVGRELPDALLDIEAAVAGGDDAAPELLDTKGFVLHLLGRHREAIDQLNLAIDAAQRQRRQAALLAAAAADPDDVAHRLRSLDHALAVMHHHRGRACRAAGLEQQARQDFEIADRKGFDPARGIF